jgi:hypothetical protein
MAVSRLLGSGVGRLLRTTARMPGRAAVAVMIAALVAAGSCSPAWAMPGAVASRTAPDHPKPQPPRPSRAAAAHAPGDHPTAPATPRSPTTVKYYIVQPPAGGKKEYLYEIAAKTLGNGNLAKEIFRLNAGRLQPGGRRLENPDVIEPGWILILPASAAGPGVHDGPLPKVTAAAASQPAAAASPATRRPHSSGTLAVADARGFSGGQVGLIAVAAALLAVILAAITAGLIWWRRSARALTADDDTAEDDPAPWPPPAIAPAPAPAPAIAPAPALATGSVPGSGTLPAPVSLPLGQAAPSRQAPPSDGHLEHREHPWHLEEHEVMLGQDRVLVALAARPVARAMAGPAGAGAAPAAVARHLAWAPDPRDGPAGGIAFTCLGAGDDGWLFLDLGQAPSAISIGGELRAAGRLAHSIAHQLCAATAPQPCTVVIIGEAVPRPHPAGATWLASLARLGSALADSAHSTAIVFCALDSDSGALELERYVSEIRSEVIPVVLTSDLEAPWSIVAEPGQDASGSAPAWLR